MKNHGKQEEKRKKSRNLKKKGKKGEKKTLEKISRSCINICDSIKYMLNKHKLQLVFFCKSPSIFVLEKTIIRS